MSNSLEEIEEMHARLLQGYEHDRAAQLAIEQVDQEGRLLSMRAMAWAEIIARGLAGLVTVDNVGHGAVQICPCGHPTDPSTGRTVFTWGEICKYGDEWETRGARQRTVKVVPSFPAAFTEALGNLDLSAVEVDE